MTTQADDRTIVIERIPFGFGKEDLLGNLFHGTTQYIIQSGMGPSLTTFTAVYNSHSKAVEALHMAKAAIAATEQFSPMCIRLKTDLIQQSHVELMDAKDRSRDNAEHERMIFVRYLSPSSSFLSVQSFFSNFGTLDGPPTIFRKSRTGEIMGVVRFKNPAVCEAALWQLGWTKSPLELDGEKIKIEPYKPRSIRRHAATHVATDLCTLRSSENYEQIAIGLIGKNQHSNTIHLCLFNAMICQLCNPDVEDRTRSLRRIQALDKSFEGTPECNFIVALAAALLEKGVVKFIDIVKEFNRNSMAPMIAWKATALLRARENLMSIKEQQEPLKAKRKPDPT